MTAFPLWAAIRTIKGRIGTWVGYERYREIDPSITRQEWAQRIGEARAALKNRTDEIVAPLNRRPSSSEITVYTSKKATGYLQQIEIFVRDRDTGLVEARPYTVKTSTLRSRSVIIEEGLSRYKNAVDTNPEDYPEDILGAVYVGTHVMSPGI